MTATDALLDPRAEALANRERDLKLEYLYLTAQRRSDPRQRRRPYDLLDQSARFLELNLLLAGFAEAVDEVGASTVRDVRDELARILDLEHAITGLDRDRVLAENRDLLRPGTAEPKPDEPVSDLLPFVFAGVRTVVAACPIEELEKLATDHGLETFAHRCRVAHDGLRAFCRRNDPQHDRHTKLIGRAYAEGRLSLGEAAELLGLTPSDAVAFLETHGLCRSLESIALPAGERAAILSRIREDRRRRGGRPEPSDASIARDVIANQRIEGVDARAWVRPPP